MPSVAPRALKIADANGNRVEAVRSYVYDGTVWRTVKYVWVGQTDGSWKVTWADAATAPATAAVTYTATAGPPTANTQANISWTAPASLIADAWRVKRADGSFVGTTVNATTLAMVDPDPRPLNGAYTVIGMLSGIEGSGTATNSIDLRLQPATFTTTWNAGANRVDFGGTRSAVGNPDNYAYYRTPITPSQAGGFVAENATPSPDPTGSDPQAGNLYRGFVMQYEARPRLSGLDGLGRTSTVNVPPAPVTAFGAAVSGTSNLLVNFLGPSDGTFTNFQIEKSTTGVGSWVVVDAANTSGVANVATSVALYFRIRTNAPGGQTYSGVFGPYSPNNDVTPPGPATLTTFGPEASYGRMVLRGTFPVDSDFNWYRVMRTYTGGPGTENISEGPGSPGAAFSVECGTIATGTMTVQVDVRDSTGNWRTSGPTASYTLAVSPTTVAATSFGSARGGAWFATDHRAYQGYLSNPALNSVGMITYDLNVASACTFKTVYGMALGLFRLGSGGVSSAQWVTIQCHNVGSPIPVSGSSPPATVFGTAHDWEQLAWGEYKTALVTTELKDLMATGAAKGFAVYRPSGTPYVVIGNTSDNAFSGAVSVYHLG